ncbi:hypothetical protein CAG99_22780 [Streptomyces marincola]|uniref:Uncharacterized protein n=1 Tax=Streptomyces marincola TaxID=2878388 RepID=A0A1W7D2N5_9ACTN|nr:hypothetical protein CAG99_22780 [Streptomyces marincola]
MDARMIEKALFLLCRAHVSRQEAVHALAAYFPGSAFEDRLTCVHEASDTVHRGERPRWPAGSGPRPNGPRRAGGGGAPAGGAA